MQSAPTATSTLKNSVVVYKLEQLHALPNDIGDADLVDDFHDGAESAPAFSATVLKAAGLCKPDTLGPVVRPIRAAPAATAAVAARARPGSATGAAAARDRRSAGAGGPAEEEADSSDEHVGGRGVASAPAPHKKRGSAAARGAAAVRGDAAAQRDVGASAAGPRLLPLLLNARDLPWSSRQRRAVLRRRRRRRATPAIRMLHMISGIVELDLDESPSQ